MVLVEEGYEQNAVEQTCKAERQWKQRTAGRNAKVETDKQGEHKSSAPEIPWQEADLFH